MVLCGEKLRVETNSFLWQKILSAGSARIVINICPNEGRRLLFLETPRGLNSIICDTYIIRSTV